MTRVLAITNNYIGKRAVVIGAGIAGLAAARALSDTFEEVILIERDRLSNQPTHRLGVPQGRHPHLLLAGAMIALGDLFPGFTNDLAQAGAVEVNAGLEMRIELPGLDPFPRYDLRRSVFALSRPLLELLLRQRLVQYPNIKLQQECRVLGLLGALDGSIVTGVQYETSAGITRNLAADLVVDASARGTITLDFLRCTGLQLPKETVVGMDMHFASASFTSPTLASGFKVITTLPNSPEDLRYGSILPIEGNRWQVVLAGRGHDDMPPADGDGFLAYARDLRTNTIYDAIKDAELISGIEQTHFANSLWRHFPQLPNFPHRLLPIGDAICRLNPVSGHGMVVALQQANMLRHLLQMEPLYSNPLEILCRTFLSEAEALIEDPWALSSISDFAHPETHGQRPAELEDSVNFHGALQRIAVHDPNICKLIFEVSHLLKPMTVLNDPEIVKQVQGELAPA